jgi:hypothetical protein
VVPDVRVMHVPCTHAHTHVHSSMHGHTHTFSHTHIHINKCARAHMYTGMHTGTRLHTLTYAHTHIHIRACPHKILDLRFFDSIFKTLCDISQENEPEENTISVLFPAVGG